jgi:tRNA A-37 threonylcarbamoyl transferase component Bud32
LTDRRHDSSGSHGGALPGGVQRGRVLERSHQLPAALTEYMSAEDWQDAARVLSHMGRFYEAGLVLLLHLPERATQVRYLTADAQRRALDAALCFARGGARREAVGLLSNLGERSKAANLLMRAGLKSEAVQAMRGEAVHGSPWPDGILFPLKTREELYERFQQEASGRPAPPDVAASDPALEFESVLRRAHPPTPAPQPVLPRTDATQTAPDIDYDDLYESRSLEAARPTPPPDPNATAAGPLRPQSASWEFPSPSPPRSTEAPLPRSAEPPPGSDPARIPTVMPPTMSRVDRHARSDPTPGGEFDDGLIRRGTRIGERFVVKDRLGAGGMATVYRVFDEELQEHVALKLFRVVDDDQLRLRRFRREMKIHRRLVHPNIVRTFDFGTWHGARYITMELLEGEDLSTWCRNRGSVVEVGVALQLMMQACDGLGHAHEQGIVHRDVKPANLFVMTGGRRLRVMDFGVAKAVDSSSISITGVRVGTPRYMSPEQIQGNQEIGPAADLYALGAVMYEVFTGNPVFEDEDLMPLLLNHLSEEPIPPRDIDPSIPREVEEVILRLLAKNPKERDADAAGLKSALLRAYVASQRM